MEAELKKQKRKHRLDKQGLIDDFNHQISSLETQLHKKQEDIVLMQNELMHVKVQNFHIYDTTATKIIKTIRENFEVQLSLKLKSYLRSLPLQDCMNLYALTHRGDKSIHQVRALTYSVKARMFLCNKEKCV